MKLTRIVGIVLTSPIIVVAAFFLVAVTVIGGFVGTIVAIGEYGLTGRWDPWWS